MEKLDFVDSHIHLYDMQHPHLIYGHWAPNFIHPVLGAQIQVLGERNFIAEDYLEITKDANVTKAIHVQAAIGSEDPVKETEWLQEASDRTGLPHGIVAFADFGAKNIQETLERHCVFENMRGIRDFEAADHFEDPSFKQGFGLMERYDLIASMGVEWMQMAQLKAVASEFPGVKMVLDHTGTPLKRDDEYVDGWRKGISSLGEVDNLWCKISGLGMGDHEWTTERIRSFVMHCIETFGTDRCFFGTNWPVDSLWSSYDSIVDAYAEIVSDFSDQERQSLFSTNAENLYRI